MQAARTYLELKDRNQFKAGFGDFPDIAIASAPQPQPELYRMCYRTVGEAFHWRDRWDWTDEEIAAHLGDPAIQLFVAMRITGKIAARLAGGDEVRRVGGEGSVEEALFGSVAAGFVRGLWKHPRPTRGRG